MLNGCICSMSCLDEDITGFCWFSFDVIGGISLRNASVCMFVSYKVVTREYSVNA